MLNKGSKSELVKVPTIYGSTNTASFSVAEGILLYEPFWFELNEPLTLVKLSLIKVLLSPNINVALLI